MHLAVLDHFVGEVVPDANVLVPLQSFIDGVSNLLTHSILKVLSSYTVVGVFWGNPRSTSCLRYNTLVAAEDAE